MKKLNSILSLIVILSAAGAVHAQTVSVDKTNLSFSAGAGGAAQVQTVNVTGSNGVTTYFAVVGSLSANSGNNPWLKVSSATSATPASSVTGTVPGALLITADPTGLTVGQQYTGTVFVGLSGFFTTSVNVSLTVGAIGVSPGSLNFTYQVNGNFPSSTPLTLSSTQTINYSATVGTDSGGNWLSAPAPLGGSSPGTVQIALNSSVVGPGMAIGTYTGRVVITPTLGPAVVVPVTLTVAAAPTVTANPASINLNYQTNGASGSTNTPSQTLTLANPGAQDLTYFIQPGSTGWLTVTDSNGGKIPANGSVQVTVNYATSSALAPNTYSGSLAIFIPGAANTPITVPVKLFVSQFPLLNVPGATLAFAYQLAGALPASKNVVATSSAAAADATSGQMALLITKSDNASWLTVPTVGQTGSATPITVSVNPTGLAVGTYNATITLNGGTAANGPQTIPVTLTVSNDPLLAATFGGCSSQNTTCPLNFPLQIGQNNPTTQPVRVTTSTGAQATLSATVAMDSSAACGAAWLSSGVTTPVVGNDMTFPITVTPGSIVSGTTCTGTVTISGTNITTGAALPNSPVTIPVKMYVSSSAMLTVNPVALNFTTSPNSPVQQCIVVGSTSATDQLNFTATRPDNAPWFTVGGASRTPTACPNGLTVGINPLFLNPGTYTSAVTITASGSGVLDSPVTVPVTLTVTGATMSVSPASLAFSQTLGGAAPAAQKLTVSTSSADIAFATAVTMTDGAGWLTATPATAAATSATPAAVTVTANGSALAPGTYHGKVTITATSQFTSGSPIDVAVTLEVKPGTISAKPTTLTFTQVQGGAAPAAQTVAVTGVPGALAFTITTSTSNNGSWLTATPTSGNTDANVQVSVSAGSLTPGQYTGKVSVVSTNSIGSPIDIPVTLNVTAPQTLSVSPATLNFSYVLGTSNTPQPQTVQLTSSNPVAFTAGVATTAPWITVTPTSGNTPATLTIGINTAGLAAGNYTGTVMIGSPAAATQPAASITVNLAVQTVPKPAITAVSNAASYVNGPISPGENIVLFGAGLGPATLALGNLTNGVYDSMVAGTQVFFDTTPAPIIYTLGGQTSVMVPYGVAGRATTSIRVVFQGVSSDPVTYSVANAAPGIYTLSQAGSGQGAILNQDNSVNAGGNPAGRNTVVAVYMTGEGTTSPASKDGAITPINGSGLFKPVQTVTATIGGVPATVEYYGSAPGIVYGVMQVNVRIPASAPTGANVPIVINVGSSATQSGASAVTLAVQ